jgi:hypothetical protein
MLLDLGLAHLGDLGRVPRYFSREERRVLFIEIDQLLADLPPLLVISLEQVRTRQTTEDEVHLEGQVVRVDQGRVHALTGFRRVSVACV